MFHRQAALAIALKVSALIAIQPVGATDLKLNVVHEQEGGDAIVPIDEDFSFYCGRAADLEGKTFSQAELFDTKIGEDGHPRCLDVEDEVTVVAYHPSHGLARKTVAVGSIRGGQQDVDIALGSPEQELARRRDLKSYDIAKFGVFDWSRWRFGRPLIRDAGETFTIRPEDVPTYEVGESLGLGLGEPLQMCVIKDIDVQVTVSHNFGLGGHSSELSSEVESVMLEVADGTGSVFYEDIFDFVYFEGTEAVGDWSLDFRVIGAGGFATWGVFINCETARDALHDILWNIDPNDEAMPKTAGQPLPAVVESKTHFTPEIQAMVDDCADGQDLTEDDYAGMDDATKDCILELFQQGLDEMAPEQIEGLAMSMP